MHVTAPHSSLFVTKIVLDICSSSLYLEISRGVGVGGWLSQILQLLVLPNFTKLKYGDITDDIERSF